MKVNDENSRIRCISQRHEYGTLFHTLSINMAQLIGYVGNCVENLEKNSQICVKSKTKFPLLCLSGKFAESLIIIDTGMLPNVICNIPILWIRIRIQLFTSMRMRIQEAKPMRFHANPDLDPGQTLPSQKAENYTLFT